ncbi:MAG: hypothetical protein UY05_C0032G0008 [Candidatus Peregrinibacteria bacterium GW2011_GWA2_47_7]|nr:MAG: hypothetical protein UY05_C0032G0008 [Candidatus Peregrinibacteria bacterium GW2011_GWA2_47_7]
MVSFFDEGTPFPVYCNDCWWSDKWDPASYGREFDFSRPFFDQFQELLLAVPKAGVFQINNENSEYNSLLAYSKNTYMSPGSYYVEDCLYVRKSQYSKDCLNANFLGQDCFMCCNLTGKRFYFKNMELNEEDYRRTVESYGSKNLKGVWAEFEQFKNGEPKRYQNQLNCENSSGDYLYNSRNASDCYDCFDIEDSKYLVECVTVKNSMDISMHDKDIEFCYELCTGGESNYNLKFGLCACASPNSSYLYSCFYLNDSFGCDGIHARQKNFILNKKYSEKEYENLISRMIEHMEKTGEYGEFFPIRISPFPYNETVAQDYFPLSKEEALRKGYSWKDSKDDLSKDEGANIMACEEGGTAYRVLTQEKNLSEKIGVSISEKCPDCRFLELFSWKNPRHLWERSCAKCSIQIQTTTSPDFPGKVYCEACYLATVY